MFSQKNNFLQDTLRFCNGERMIIDLLQPLDKSASLFWKTPDTQIENTKKLKFINKGNISLIFLRLIIQVQLLIVPI